MATKRYRLKQPEIIEVWSADRERNGVPEWVIDFFSSRHPLAGFDTESEVLVHLKTGTVQLNRSTLEANYEPAD